MWNTYKNTTCPCPSGVSKDIPVVRIQAPKFEDDLEKINDVGKHYTGLSTPVIEKAEEASKIFVGPYMPMPYTFRLGSGPPQRGQHARNPPLWLLIDHTLAVIWCLFSPQKEQTLGVVQLQWALAFLSGIRTENGQHPADVKICIDAIKNRLFTHFSDAEDNIGEKKIPCDLHVCDPCFVNKAGKESIKSKGLSTIREETSRGGLDAESQTLFICPNLKEKRVPLSVTINSVLKSHSPSVHQLFKAGSSTINNQSEEGFSLPKPAVTSPSEMPLDAATSKDEVLDFLTKWREDQLSRIEGEMTRLRSIETLMKNVDSALPVSRKKGN